jgi:hypothetical protein
VDDHIGQGAQPIPALDAASALRQSGRTSPTTRMIVERDTPDLHVMGDPVAPEHRGGQQPVDEHRVPGTAFVRPLVRPIGQSRVLTRLRARPQIGDQLSQDREGQSGPPAIGDSAPRARLLDTTTLRRDRFTMTSA